MKTYEQRTKDIQSKIKKKKTQRNALVATVTACCCIALAVFLYQPTEAPTPNITQKPKNDYTPLIEALRNIDGIKLDYDSIVGISPPVEEAVPDAGIPNEPTNVAPSATPDFEYNSGTGKYEEVTDLQVQGVGEADLIKRTSSHIFYLRNGTLSIYSIAGEESVEVDSYTPISPESNYGSGYQHEMYLSEDCTIVTIISQCVGNDSFVRILTLDVSDPSNIRFYKEQRLSGTYSSSRMIGDKLYVFTRFYVQSANDIEDKDAYLPSYVMNGETCYPTMDCIVLPEDPTVARYTVITQLEAKTLEVKDTVALLSYTGAPYVSQENIFLTRSYTDSVEMDTDYFSKSMTEISQIRYNEDGLTHIASFSVEGNVKNQYSMDEKDEILRVVTTVDEYCYERRINSSGRPYYKSHISASLYCVDLRSHSIRASVESFAPEGETVRSVRFEGDNAYVCTAILVTDPVFFFDLSDIDNITYKDTGNIDGFSSSLVDFGNGFLVGIGTSNWTDLKIEIYREGVTAVESHCSYEHQSWFSDDYKAYYIDRENQLIGLAMMSNKTRQTDYVLLHFNGTELYEIARTRMTGDLDDMRSVYIDGYLYMFGDEFRVEKVEISSDSGARRYQLTLKEAYPIVNTLEESYLAGEPVIIQLDELSDHYYQLYATGATQDLEMSATSTFVFTMPNEDIVVEIEDRWVSLPQP